MRIGVIAAILVGLAAATAVVGWIGFSAVYHALAAIGWRGVGFLCLYSAIPAALLGTAWFVLAPLAPSGRWLTFVGARMVRDAGAELLPFSHVGGFVIGARAAMLGGVPSAQASSTTVVDVTTEIIAQLGFVGLGLAILALRAGDATNDGALLEGGLVGLAFLLAGAVGLVAIQRRGLGFIEPLTRRFVPRAAASAGAFTQALSALYDRPMRLALAVCVHFAAWLASGTGVWLALRLAGVHIGLAAILAIESLVGAVRGAAFVVPMGIGVQEATYAVVGSLFGLGPDMALAVSLLKRARDMLIGVPTLLAWQGLEGRRLVHRVGAEDDRGRRIDGG
ncbi:MAG TPA: lysylphosphatidylglycerol synthase domain-containing protein [Caulobacteraceae bacterium]|nr:lysylphosphatidylglycerol synthase domain-containing protein [Caulobacteraceae bacterium]